jgi:hypothetical protein
MEKDMTIRTKPLLSLDERVAAAMAAPDSPPSIFADLIAEVDVVAKHSDQQSREARALSVDSTVVDPAARSRAVDAELIAERHRNAITALQERHSAAVTREQLAAWHADADRVQAVRDQLSAELADRYPAITAELVDLFSRIAASDREIARINASAPGYDQRRLLSVELTARGIDRFGLNDKRIAETVRLPAFVRGHGSVMAWPVPTVPFSVQASMMPRW